VISETVTLNAEFFFPDPQSCDLTPAVNGPTIETVTSFWECDGALGDFSFALSADGNVSFSNGVESAYPITTGGCGFRELFEEGFFSQLVYSPALNVMNFYEYEADEGEFEVATCTEQNLAM
jgi:hypothetical protein